MQIYQTEYDTVQRKWNEPFVVLDWLQPDITE